MLKLTLIGREGNIARVSVPRQAQNIDSHVGHGVYHCLCLPAAVQQKQRKSNPAFDSLKGGWRILMSADMILKHDV